MLFIEMVRNAQLFDYRGSRPCSGYGRILIQSTLIIDLCRQLRRHRLVLRAVRQICPLARIYGVIK